jgi:hypothetical protein
MHIKSGQGVYLSVNGTTIYARVPAHFEEAA